MSQKTAYPRPHFQRPNINWSTLNGQWDFAFDDRDEGLSQRWEVHGLPSSNETTTKRQIQVPFVFQTPASGINDQNAHEVIWYERKIDDIRTSDEISKDHRLLLRFGAVDYQATLWLNGLWVGDHRGGHVPFDINLTEARQPHSEGNRLTVRVQDSPSDLTQPRGKQYWKPKSESIFYTPSSGIWQDVWLESVPLARIADSSRGTVLRSNDIDAGDLHAEIVVHGRRAREALSVEISAKLGTAKVSTVRQPLDRGKNLVNIKLPMWLDQAQIDSLHEFPPTSNNSAWRTQSGKYLALWSPEHPLLYDIEIRLYRLTDELIDEVHTITGMRSLSWNHPDRQFRLNNQPYFQALVLDQGYWPDTNMTPPSPEALKADIELSKAMGFNGCRKHQKVEDPRFLYWADRLGYLVWGEMANAYEFSSTYMERFDNEWEEAIRRDINHPCIVTWTPGNESWGYDDLKGNTRQREHIRSLYHTTKALDPTRPVNDNCGWQHVRTDLTTFHEYADAPQLKEICATMEGVLRDKAGRSVFVPKLADDPGCQPSDTAPVICTEFGGVNIAPAEGQEGGDRDWGYTTASDPEDLLKRFEALVMAVVDGGICCGLVYTQLTDIEQEVNGLYTFDRRPKLDVAKVKGIMDRAKARYLELLEQNHSGREK